MVRRSAFCRFPEPLRFEDSFGCASAVRRPHPPPTHPAPGRLMPPPKAPPLSVGAVGFRTGIESRPNPADHVSPCQVRNRTLHTVFPLSFVMTMVRFGSWPFFADLPRNSGRVGEPLRRRTVSIPFIDESWSGMLKTETISRHSVLPARFTFSRYVGYRASARHDRTFRRTWRRPSAPSSARRKNSRNLHKSHTARML